MTIETMHQPEQRTFPELGIPVPRTAGEWANRGDAYVFIPPQNEQLAATIPEAVDAETTGPKVFTREPVSEDLKTRIGQTASKAYVHAQGFLEGQSGEREANEKAHNETNQSQEHMLQRIQNTRHLLRLQETLVAYQDKILQWRAILRTANLRGLTEHLENFGDLVGYGGHGRDVPEGTLGAQLDEANGAVRHTGGLLLERMQREARVDYDLYAAHGDEPPLNKQPLILGNTVGNSRDKVTAKRAMLMQYIAPFEARARQAIMTEPHDEAELYQRMEDPETGFYETVNRAAAKVMNEAEYAEYQQRKGSYEHALHEYKENAGHLEETKGLVTQKEQELIALDADKRQLGQRLMVLGEMIDELDQACVGYIAQDRTNMAERQQLLGLINRYEAELAKWWPVVFSDEHAELQEQLIAGAFERSRSAEPAAIAASDELQTIKKKYY